VGEREDGPVGMLPGHRMLSTLPVRLGSSKSPHRRGVAALAGTYTRSVRLQKLRALARERWRSPQITVVVPPAPPPTVVISPAPPPPAQKPRFRARAWSATKLGCAFVAGAATLWIGYLTYSDQHAIDQLQRQMDAAAAASGRSHAAEQVSFVEMGGTGGNNPFVVIDNYSTSPVRDINLSVDVRKIGYVPCGWTDNCYVVDFYIASIPACSVATGDTAAALVYVAEQNIPEARRSQAALPAYTVDSMSFSSLNGLYWLYRPYMPLYSIAGNPPLDQASYLLPVKFSAAMDCS
jgi:hypothetical protein